MQGYVKTGRQDSDISQRNQLKAVFGDLDRVSGGQEDIYHLAGNAKIRIELFCSTKLDRYKDNKRLEEADTFVTLTGVDKTEDFQQIEEMTKQELTNYQIKQGG